MTTKIETLRKQVALAQTAARTAEATLEAAEQDEAAAKAAKAIKDALAAEDEAFILDEPDEFSASWSDVRPYVLPFGRGYPKWSPFDVDNASFGKDWLAGMSALICKRIDQQRTRPSRLIFTAGVGPVEHDRIGQVFTARHDQTGAKLGVYAIVGIVIYGLDGSVARTIGDTPDVKMSQNTYK